MSSLVQPELVWLAVAFTVLMAGMLAAAAEEETCRRDTAYSTARRIVDSGRVIEPIEP